MSEVNIAHDLARRDIDDDKFAPSLPGLPTPESP